MTKRKYLSVQETEFIKANFTTMSDREIAEKLGRLAPTITKFRQRYGYLKPDNPAGKARQVEISPEQKFEEELTHSVQYFELKKMFSDEELAKYVRRWIELNMQFTKEGLLASEREQLSQLVRLEILIDRNFVEQRQAIEEGARLEVLIHKEEKKTDRDQSLILDLHRDLAVVLSSGKSQRKDLLDMQSKHGSILKDLKATRDQRVKAIEGNKETFSGFIKYIIQEEVREREARQIELMRLAAEKKQKQLGEFFDYGDGNIDRILLNCDTVRGSDESSNAKGNDNSVANESDGTGVRSENSIAMPPDRGEGNS